MRIDIWSDVVCPWCFIGKRRLESALAEFEHADDVEITWHSFQLDPGAPTEPTETTAEHLGRKYGGGPAAGQQMIDRVEAVAAEEGLLFRLGETRRANTVDAHRLLHLAHEEGGSRLQGRLKEALLSAYFLSAENPADSATLTRIATDAGLPANRVTEVLASREFEDAVEADVAQAAAFGAGGVPFFVIDQKYGVSGAQPVEVFSQVLERARREAHPAVTLLAAGDACGPDGCAV